MSWFNLWMSTPPHTVAHSLFSSGMKESIGRVEVIKLVGWDKKSSVGKGKATHENKSNQGIGSPLPRARQVFSHLKESRGPSCIMVTWDDNCHCAEYPPLPPSPNFTCWEWCHYGVGYLFSHLESALPAVSSCNFLCSPSFLSSGVGWGMEKTLCNHCSAVTKTLLCYQHFTAHSPSFQHGIYYLLWGKLTVFHPKPGQILIILMCIF